MESTQQLIHRIAQLETANDQLEAELSYVDELLRGVGFPEGIHSVKSIAEEILEYENEELE